METNRKQNQNKLCIQCDDKIEYDCLERVFRDDLCG